MLLHLSCFWLLVCGNVALFRTGPRLAWSPGLGQNTSSGGIFSKKNYVLLANFFSSNKLFIRLFLANTCKKNRGSPCSFKRKREFISLSSLVWRKSLTFCTCTHSCAHVDDAKIVRSRDAQCNTKELPQKNLLENCFSKKTCLLFSMSDYLQFITTFICCVKQMKQEMISWAHSSLLISIFKISDWIYKF